MNPLCAGKGMGRKAGKVKQGAEPPVRWGYAAMALGPGLTTSRTVRLKNATPERLQAVIARNLEALQAILAYNVRHNFRLFRIGSGIIPFGSHPANQVPWWRVFGPALAAIGQFAQQHGLRLSMHPGQYTVLNSPNPEVVARAVDDLNYHARFLDALGLSAHHKVVVHVGGAYGDKAAALDRLVQAARRLPASTLARLVLENDERNFNAAEALQAARLIGTPVVFDNLHDRLNPSPEPLDSLIPAIFATWRGDRPKVHFSSQAPGRRPGAHAFEAEPAEFVAFLDRLAPYGPFDVLVEAKGKDLALQALAPWVPGLRAESERP